MITLKLLKYIGIPLLLGALGFGAYVAIGNHAVLKEEVIEAKAISKSAEVSMDAFTEAYDYGVKIRAKESKQKRRAKDEIEVKKTKAEPDAWINTPVPESDINWLLESTD